MIEVAQSSKKVVGIGEVGLDFFRLTDDVDKIKSLQQEVFKKFINLAKELALPLVLHCRGEENKPYEAYDMMLDVLQQEKYYNGVIHCYGGNLEQANKFLDLGFYIGITGIVTFKNAKELGGDHKDQINQVADWLDKNDIYYDRITAEKLAADFYIDDKAIHIPNGDWNIVMNVIKKRIKYKLS